MKNKTWRVIACLSAGVMSLMLAACGGDAASAPAATAKPAATAVAATDQPAKTDKAAGDKAAGNEGVTIKSIVLKRDNGNNEAGDTVDQFLATDRTQYFEAETSRLLDAGTKVKWSFTAVKTTSGNDILIKDVTTDVLVANQLSAHISLPNDWPVGSYKVDVYFNDNLIKTLNYEVVAAK